MKKLLAALGLAVMVAGCDKTNVSTVGENEVLTKPVGCETVKDIRFYTGSRGFHGYQLLCEQDGGLVLYTRGKDSGAWTGISVRQ
ncbi:MAG: hypothetical protein QME12_02925 [Nanoarchaeota archaeon]|nr:hypothetical protein [Nanoarchaeota archaeon]